MVEQTLSLFKVDYLTKIYYEGSTNTCVGNPSMYPTYCISCLTTSSLGDNTSQCNQRDSNPGWCRPNISLLGLLASTGGCPKYVSSHFYSYVEGIRRKTWRRMYYHLQGTGKFFIVFIYRWSDLRNYRLLCMLSNEIQNNYS